MTHFPQEDLGFPISSDESLPYSPLTLQSFSKKVDKIRYLHSCGMTTKEIYLTIPLKCYQHANNEQKRLGLTPNKK